MPPPDRMLATLQKATALVKSTPGRTGHRLRIESGVDLLVVGDLHGNLANFQAIWKLADLGKHPSRHLVVQELVHGKFLYPAGGEKSHQLVDLFAAIKCQYPERVHYLPGNHEMGQWTGRQILKGADDLNAVFRQGVATAYGDPDPILSAYRALWEASPLLIHTPHGVALSHTLVPGKSLDAFEVSQLESETYTDADLKPGGTAYGMMWGRDTSDATVRTFLTKIQAHFLITGHFPADEGFTRLHPNLVALDCSGSPGGYLLFPLDRALDADELAGLVGVV